MQTIANIDHGGMTIPAARIRIAPAARPPAVAAAILQSDPGPDPGPIDNRHARRRAAALDRTRRKRLKRLRDAIEALESRLA